VFAWPVACCVMYSGTCKDSIQISVCVTCSMLCNVQWNLYRHHRWSPKNFFQSPPKKFSELFKPYKKDTCKLETQVSLYDQSAWQECVMMMLLNFVTMRIHCWWHLRTIQPPVCYFLCQCNKWHVYLFCIAVRSMFSCSQKYFVFLESLFPEL
jgi:hypothetical protein